MKMRVNLHLLIPLIIALQVTRGFQHQALTQLHDAKLKLSHLESVLKETTEYVETRTQHLASCHRKIQEMDDEIRRLNSSLSTLKRRDDEKINALEEEVRSLRASWRNNNVDLRLMESRAQEAEERLQALNSRFQRMQEIVTEQWTQIKQFEQALQLKQMRLLKAQRPAPGPASGPASVSMLLKFQNARDHLQEALGLLASTLRSYMVQILPRLERFYSSAKEFHYELQDHIKEEMESHEFTAHFANDELVFFLVSAIIVFPILVTWMLLSSQLS